MKKFKLGLTVKDKITGFTGVLMGHANYYTGCDQYLLQPKANNSDKYPESLWLDEGRLEIIKEPKAESAKGKRKGCDYSPPKK